MTGRPRSIPRTMTKGVPRMEGRSILIPWLLLSLQILPSVATGEDAAGRQIRLRSTILSSFWGRDTFIEAMVVAPPGHDPVKKWPTCYEIHNFGGWGQV